jgi:hypothetical protein
VGSGFDSRGAHETPVPSHEDWGFFSRDKAQILNLRLGRFSIRGFVNLEPRLRQTIYST